MTFFASVTNILLYTDIFCRNGWTQTTVLLAFDIISAKPLSTELHSYILRGEKSTPLTFSLSFTLFSLSNYGVAVFSPTKHYSYRGNVTSAQLFNSYTSTVIG